MPDHARLAALRREYTSVGLDETDLAATWHEQLRRWLDDALAADLTEPNAVVLGTADAAGRPSVRTVLLKGFDEIGLTVFTNYESRKAREVQDNPHGSMVLPWVELQRQVLARGRMQRISPEESAAYFRSRPRGAQLSAWTSHQSAVIGSRAALEERRAELEQRFGDEIPVPDFWGGLRLEPDAVEFWQGRPDRLHDRLQFRRTDGAWVVERLQP